MKTCCCLLFLCLLYACDRQDAEPAAAPVDPLPAGTGKIVFTDYAPLAGKPVTLHYIIPEGDAEMMPIVFVMPGTNRDADVYLKSWESVAGAVPCMVFSFEFPETYYSDNEYITGNVIDSRGGFIPREQWTFALLDPVFDMIRTRTGNRNETYSLFGHSAGAQFVHRYMLFCPATRVDRAVAANAGWYTMPSFSVAFPYGLKNTQLSDADVIRAFRANLTVHLGTADTGTNDASLRKTPEANAQGAHRYARGLYFYGQSRKIAVDSGYDFQWTLREVAGTGHDQAAMSADAAKIFFNTCYKQ
jgi:pimeloyl-ACP methyl ester carboxylesterase